jgi:hypothetical protein
MRLQVSYKTKLHAVWPKKTLNVTLIYKSTR